MRTRYVGGAKGEENVFSLSPPRGGRPRLIIILEYAVTFNGRGFGRVAEVAETQVLEARLACEGRLWMNHREKHEVWTLLD